MELDELKKDAHHCSRGQLTDTSGKVNVLLQSYIGQSRVKSFTLQSDTNFVAQNAGRISRALFEMCLKRGWSGVATQFLTLSKCIDRRMRPEQSPLRQLEELPIEVS